MLMCNVMRDLPPSLGATSCSYSWMGTPCTTTQQAVVPVGRCPSGIMHQLLLLAV
jgi:hypothetical protein